MKKIEFDLKILFLQIALASLFIYLLIWLLNCSGLKLKLELFPQFFAFCSLVFFSLYLLYGTQSTDI